MTYRFLSESSVRTGALSSGQVDLIEGISGNDAGLFRDDPEFHYQHALNSGTPCTLYLNTTYGPTQDVRVRRAVVNAICSGVVAIEMGKVIDRGFKEEGLTQHDSKAFETFSSTVLLAQPSVAEDLVGVSRFLASADSDYVTGQSIVVDGGVVLI